MGICPLTSPLSLLQRAYQHSYHIPAPGGARPLPQSNPSIFGLLCLSMIYCVFFRIHFSHMGVVVMRAERKTVVLDASGVRYSISGWCWLVYWWWHNHAMEARVDQAGSPHGVNVLVSRAQLLSLDEVVLAKADHKFHQSWLRVESFELVILHGFPLFPWI